MQLNLNISTLVMFIIGIAVGVNFSVLYTLNYKTTTLDTLHKQIEQQQLTITKLTEQKESDLRLLRELRRQLKKN